MQTIQTSMLNQINQMLDSQLKNLGDGSEADAEKKRSVQADVQNFQPGLRFDDCPHVLANHEASV
jgi:hypothetical protein